MGVIAGVHYRTTYGGTDTLMTGLTCLTKLDGLVLEVTNLTDCCLTIKANDTNFTGGKSYLCGAVFLSHKLSECACGTNELSALTGIEFDVVNDSTYRNCGDGEYVTGLNVCISAGCYYVTVGKTNGSDDVALLTLFVLKESDVRGSVGVVLNTDNLCGSLGVSLKINKSVLLLVAAAVMTNGDLAVAVTACVLLLLYDEALLGRELGNFIEGRACHISARRSCRLILLYCHF